MNREPIALYVLRLLTSLFLFFFMCMLYWSSTLIEQDMKGVQEKLKTLESKVSDLKLELSSKSLKNDSSEEKSSEMTAISDTRKQIDPSLPNLLSVDPFYAKTLPEMLGTNFKPHGKIKQATIGKPENLHPFSAWGDVIEWTNMCNVSVAAQKFGIYDTYAPDMAIKMELREDKRTGEKQYWVHLRDGVFFEPLRKDYFSEDISLNRWFLQKHRVTAHDFKFYLDAILNPYVQEAGAIALRNYFADIEEFKVIDDLTFYVRWKEYSFTDDAGKTEKKPKYVAKLLTASLKPLATFVYQRFADGKKIVEEDSDVNFYRTNSIWGQNFSNHFAKNIIVSCGPWVFDGMTERQIQFVRNQNFFNPLAALADSRVFEFKQSTESIWQDFKSNNLDTYPIQPDQLIEYENFLKSDQYKGQKEKGDEIERLDYVARRYVHIQWNETKPFFQDKKVRQALTMAIDRNRIIKQNLNGMGTEITGPFFKYSKAYDDSIKPWPFDPHRAAKQLEEAGWYDSDGDGIIDKEIDGKRVPFRFSLTYYVKNSAGKAIVEYISTALKEIGIDAQLKGVDIADLTAAFEDKSFDAFFFIWGLGSPPEDPEQLWHSSLAKVKGSSNAIGFQNKEADAIIEKLKIEYNEDERTKLYHEFDRIIHEEAPYTFLYMPKWILLYRKYLQNVFVPADRQDLIPGANVEEPDSSIYWIKTSHV